MKTPNIDRLAASGVRFHAAYLGACVESMRMKGKYSASTYDPKQCPFWPSELRQQDYHIAQIGKCHTRVDSGWGRDWGPGACEPDADRRTTRP